MSEKSQLQKMETLIDKLLDFENSIRQRTGLVWLAGLVNWLGF